MTYQYIRSEPQLWTVGFYKPDGRFEPESDHGSPAEAAARVRWLNGGDDDVDVDQSDAVTDDGPQRTGDGPLDEWMVVEMLGHRRVAGRVREVQVAGAGFLRLDIPASDGREAQTQFIAPGSVYALHPVAEAIARAAAGRLNTEPVHRWELPAAAIGAEPHQPDDEDLDDDEPF